MENPGGDTLYSGLCGTDILLPLLPLFRSGHYRIRPDGKIEPVHTGLDYDTPWLHVRKAENRNCGLWHRVFRVYYGIVPNGCQQCWKTVARPRSLLETYRLWEAMVQLNLPSKIGMEIRESVPALWGGYFYADSREEGLEMYKLVRRAIDENEHLGPEINVLLKRGCTEFEHEFGPSDQWKVSDAQANLETRLEQAFAPQEEFTHQPQFLRAHVMRKWVEWAYAHGDQSYLAFTGGQPLCPPYVTYHGEQAEHGDTGGTDPSGS